MPKTEPQLLLDLYALQRKHAPVASMEDLGVGHEKLSERFWKRVIRESGDHCWQWQGAKVRNGYGRLYIANHRWFLAHRFAFLLKNKAIEPFLCVMHSCDNKGCVNPSHLSQGPVKVNTRDAWERHLMPRGEQNGMATIAEKTVLAIRREYAEGGVTMRDVAERFGVHNSQVCRIVNSKSRRLRGICAVIAP